MAPASGALYCASATPARPRRWLPSSRGWVTPPWWVGDAGGDLFTPLGNLLGATTTATIATGILNVWMHTPEEAASEHARLVAEHGPRFLCGIGISHQPLVDRLTEPGTYTKPMETMSEYLDRLDAAPTPLAVEDRVIAALGPKMLELARTRAAGTHPYLVTPELTKSARRRRSGGSRVSVAGLVGGLLEVPPAREAAAGLAAMWCWRRGR